MPAAATRAAVSRGARSFEDVAAVVGVRFERAHEVGVPWARRHLAREVRRAARRRRAMRSVQFSQSRLRTVMETGDPMVRPETHARRHLGGVERSIFWRPPRP